MTLVRTKVTAVIVAYESRDIIGMALDSLYQAQQAGVAECVVVDNASKDGTAAFIEEQYPWVTLVTSKQNLGYGSGCNLGLRMVHTPYVLFMNPDVNIKVDALDQLIRFADEHPQAGLIAPAIKRQAGNYQLADCLPTPMSLIRQAAGLSASEKRMILPGAAPFKTNWICGAAIFAPSNLMCTIGGFDPRFFLYFEETDLCLRVSKAGYELWAFPSAEATHASNASARKIRPDLADGGCLEEHFYPSRFYYLAKHHGLPAAVLVELSELFLKGIRDVGRLVTFRSYTNHFGARLRFPFLTYPPQVRNQQQ